MRRGGTPPLSHDRLRKLQNGYSHLLRRVVHQPVLRWFLQGDQPLQPAGHRCIAPTRRRRRVRLLDEKHRAVSAIFVRSADEAFRSSSNIRSTAIRECWSRPLSIPRSPSSISAKWPTRSARGPASGATTRLSIHRSPRRSSTSSPFRGWPKIWKGRRMRLSSSSPTSTARRSAT